MKSMPTTYFEKVFEADESKKTHWNSIFLTISLACYSLIQKTMGIFSSHSAKSLFKPMVYRIWEIPIQVAENTVDDTSAYDKQQFKLIFQSGSVTVAV